MLMLDDKDILSKRLDRISRLVGMARDAVEDSNRGALEQMAEHIETQARLLGREVKDAEQDN